MLFRSLDIIFMLFNMTYSICFNPTLSASPRINVDLLLDATSEFADSVLPAKKKNLFTFIILTTTSQFLILE